MNIIKSLKQIQSIFREQNKHLPTVKILVLILGVFGSVIGICSVFNLQTPYILFLLLFSLYLLPSIVCAIVKSSWERNRFMNVLVYMEQAINSYKRNNSIIKMLDDCISIFEDWEPIKQLLQEAYLIRKTGKKADGTPVEININLTEAALRVIEDAYPSRRLHLLHNFFVKAEKTGGNINQALEVQLNEINKWKERTMIFQQTRAKLKTDMAIGIILSLLLCYFTLFIPRFAEIDFELSASTVFQLCTTVSIVFFMVTAYQVLKKLSGTWLDAATINSKYETIILRKYHFVKNYEKHNAVKKAVLPILISVLIGLFLAIAGRVFLPVPFSYIFLAGGVILFLFVIMGTLHKKKKYIKAVQKEIKTEFPYWLLSVTLSLQTESVYNAVRQTTNETHGVLKEELDEFCEQMRKNPASLNPYTNFFKKFHVEELKSGMKVLYSVNANGIEDMQNQLNFLAEQNNNLMDNAEKLRFENQIAGISLAKFVPMLITCLKLLVDLTLTMGGMFNLLSNLV